MKKYIDLIKNIDLLNSISDKNILNNLRDGSFRVVSYMKDNILHFDGERCRKFELILSGKIIINRIDESGNLLNISEFYAGDILGGNLLFSKSPYYPMTISASQPSLILEINREKLFNMFTDDHIFLRKYLQYISDNANILGDKIKHFINKTIREKVINFLEYEAKKQNSNYIKLNITKTALAEKLGVQRTSLSRELAKMRKEGLISFDAKSITILDDIYK